MIGVRLPDHHGRSVGIFKLRYPIPSETFITSQALALTTYQPLFLARKKTNATDTPLLALSDHDPYGFRQGWLALTRSVSFFLQDERVRNLSLVHAHFGPDGVYALNLAERLAIPLVVTFHGLDTTARRWRLFTSLFGVTIINYFRYVRRLQEHGAAFIAVSGFIRDCLVAQGFPAEKIHQLYIGVDTQLFCPLPETGRTGNNRYILNVARHVPVKGVDTLLRAFARCADRHPGVTLTQVGAGPLTGSLQSLARELGIADRVRFLGVQTPHEVLELMQRAELLALTSQTADTGAREGLGIVLNEASACGIPVVATRCGGIPEAVIDGETGLLCAERDDRQLADNLDILLENEDLRLRMGRRGRDYVGQKFCLRTQTEKLERLYDLVVDERQCRVR
jgi:glycosyltransferase involved in cell wall biosynthesis